MTTNAASSAAAAASVRIVAGDPHARVSVLTMP